jgi:multicomponent K+:H+ antiporter subunit E
MLSKLLPHPLLTLTLIAVWQMLMNTVSIGTLVFGVILGIIVPIITAAYWPDRPRLIKPLKFAEYCLIVMWDIIVANVVVAGIVLFKPNARINSQWVTVPIDLNSAEAITMLAGTITMTPGTLTADVSACGHALLVHCLDTDDPEAVRDEIKQRYERRLKEIFE